MRVICAALAYLALLSAAPNPATADDPSTGTVLAREARFLAGNFTLKADMLALTGPDDAAGNPPTEALGNQLSFQLDTGRRSASVRLAAGSAQSLTLRFDAHVALDNGARIAARLDLGVVGYRLSLTTPALRVRPRSYQGHAYLEYSLPLFEFKF